jgi:hypothetical protein
MIAPGTPAYVEKTSAEISITIPLFFPVLVNTIAM